MRFIIILKTKDLGDLMKHKKYSMAITEEERKWFHELAKVERKSIATMIIHCFRRKSEQLGIPLPEDIIPDNKRIYREDDHDITFKGLYIKRITENNVQISCID